MLKIKQSLAILGGIALVTTAFKNFKTLIKLLPAFHQNFSSRYISSNQKSWGIITGAAQGIGFAFASELAKQNLNIIIIDKNEESLIKAKNEIQSVNQTIQIITISMDFSLEDQLKLYSEIYSSLENLDIALLVNNVGMMPTSFLQQFHLLSEKDVLIVNIFPCVFLTQLILQRMLLRKQKSAIINLSSATAYKPMPYNSIYSASKAFMNFFSQAISFEYKNKIDIIALTPNNVASSMTGVLPSFQNLTPEECAKGCLRYLGKLSLTDGNLRHLFQFFVFRIKFENSYFNEKIRWMTMPQVKERMFNAYCKMNKINMKDKSIKEKIVDFVFNSIQRLV